MMLGIDKLLNLLDTDIPQCKRRLQDSHINLEDVATYCEVNYVRASDKRLAMEETKSYMTQSLASVAYQINLMSVSFLQLLDMEVEQVSEMEVSINHLSQVISIHKEKVARREIGELTSNKSYFWTIGVKSNGVLMPEKPEQPIAYVRKPIDFSALDYLGASKKFSDKQDHPAYLQKNLLPGKVASNISPNYVASAGEMTQSIDARPNEPAKLVDSFPLPVQVSLLSMVPELESPLHSSLPPHFSDLISVAPEEDGGPLKLLKSAQSGGTADDVAEPFASRISRMILDEASWIPQDYIEKVVAVYSYTGDKADELSFDEGAIIYVTEKNEDGWWEGMMNAQTGLFPSNYVEPCI